MFYPYSYQKIYTQNIDNAIRKKAYSENHSRNIQNTA